MATAQEVAKTTLAIVGYGACSSLMLVVNKVCVHLLPAPSFVLLAQFFCSWFAVKACGMAGLITVDKLESGKMRAFLPVSLAFLAAVFANMKTLQFANVETFIVFRASTPLTISICDYLCLGRELPNLRSVTCLSVLLCCATGYVLSDAQFKVHGYVWVAVWYVIFCFDQLYIKYAVDHVKVESNWGRVFYTNLWACILAGAVSALTEPDVLLAFEWSSSSIAALTVSCFLGVGMSYFAFLCRSQVSATYFTVIGNVCKVITVLVNVFIWDKHATNTGLGFLFACLFAAYFYEQSPMRLQTPAQEEAEQLFACAERLAEIDAQQVGDTRSADRQ
jgi:solute carrier family 35 protein